MTVRGRAKGDRETIAPQNRVPHTLKITTFQDQRYEPPRMIV
jgi:hypothetical protein